MIKNKEFQVCNVSQDQTELLDEIAKAFDQLLLGLDSVCPKNREFSIVKTKLEEACFYAKKSIFYPVDKFINRVG